MKVAVVTTSFPSFEGDPAGHFVSAEARRLVELGHSVVVIAPARRTSDTDGNPRIVRLAGGGLFGAPGAAPRLRQNPLRAIGGARFVLAASRLLGRLDRIDRVVAHWLVPCAWPIATRSGLPVEAVAHGSDVRLVAALPVRLRRHIVARLASRCVKIRFVSNELRSLLAGAPGIDLGVPTEVRPCGIDLTGACGRERARDVLGVDPSARLVVIVGRLIASKRVDVALSVASRASATRIVVVGDGPERWRLEREFPRVTFTGQVPRPVALSWIAAADVLLAASTEEGAPTVVREARALGVPVVAAAAGDLVEWAERDPGITVFRRRAAIGAVTALLSGAARGRAHPLSGPRSPKTLRRQ